MAPGRCRMNKLICAVAVLAVSSVAEAGAIRYVDDDANPGGDGLSWATALQFLQDALANPAPAVTEIRVAQGTYRPDRDQANPNGTGDRTASFRLVFFLNGVAIQGGDAGLGAPDADEHPRPCFD